MRKWKGPQIPRSLLHSMYEVHTEGGGYDKEQGGQWKPGTTVETAFQGVVMPLNNEDLQYIDSGSYKLDGIAAGANKYVHPTHTAAASGLYKTTVDAEGHVTATTPVTKSDITKLGIPAQNTTYPMASATEDGRMSKEDKSKLDGMSIATDSEVSEMLAEVYGE